MVPMTNNLFPLPYWAPALQRVPKPLQVLNEAYLRGERSRECAEGLRPLTILPSFRRKPESNCAKRK